MDSQGRPKCGHVDMWALGSMTGGGGKKKKVGQSTAVATATAKKSGGRQQLGTSRPLGLHGTSYHTARGEAGNFFILTLLVGK